MRSPFHKAPSTAASPRIRTLTGASSRAKVPPAPAAGTVFSEFVATLERLEKSRRRRKPQAPAKGE